MSTMTLSAKRLVLLSAELCQELTLAPGAQVEVQRGLSRNGSIIHEHHGRSSEHFVKPIQGIIRALQPERTIVGARFPLLQI